MDTEEPKMKKDEENENKVENKRKKVKEKITNFSEKKLQNCFFQSNYVSDVDKVEYFN